MKLFLFDSCKGVVIFDCRWLHCVLMFFFCVLQLSTLNSLLFDTCVVFLLFASYLQDACHCDCHCHYHYHYHRDSHI